MRTRALLMSHTHKRRSRRTTGKYENVSYDFCTQKKKLCMCPLVIYRVLSHYGSECLKYVIYINIYIISKTYFTHKIIPKKIKN